MKVKDLHPRAPGSAATRGVRSEGIPLALPAELGLSRRLDVIEATIRAPALRPAIVPRGPLVSRLRRESAAVVTIVAPAGYGKTTLLAQWAVAEARPVAWLTAGARDNVPRVLLDHLAASLDRAQRDGRAPRAPIREVGRPTSPVDALAADAIAAGEQPLLLVIDNADLLQAAAARRVLTSLVARLPRGSTIALGARSEPRLSFGSRRARGGLRELGVDELALTNREAQLLLQATEIPLPNQQMEELIDLCEGWPAALYLASLSTRASATEAAISPFGGADRYLVEYLQAEYLPQLRPGDLRFLRRASMLGDLTGPRCDAVLEEQDSELRLQRLADANLAVVALGGSDGGYRFQRLLRQFFLRELVDAEPDIVPALHRRAADWYARVGRRDRELEHAEAAGDTERVVALVGETLLRTAGQRGADDVARRLARLDEAGHLARHPDVVLQAAWIEASRGRADEAERLLAIAADAARRRSSAGAGWRGGVPVVRAALCRDGARRMLADAAGAAARLPRSSQWYPLALHMRGCAAMLLGAEEEADAVLADAARAAAVHGAFLTQMIAVSQQSGIALRRDDPDRAAALACDAAEILARADLLSAPAAAIALAVSARTQLRLGRWANARELVDAAEPLRAGLTEALPWLAVGARVELGHCYATLRDLESARAVVGEIEAILALRPGLELLDVRAAELRDEVESLDTDHAHARTDLTPAERRVLPLLGTHLSFREIGEQLGVSRNTVKTQAISIYRKLGVKGRSDAIAASRSGTFGASG